MCVSVAFLFCFVFLLRASTVFCLAGLLLTPGIYSFHNFPVWMLCVGGWEWGGSCFKCVSLEIWRSLKSGEITCCMITCVLAEHMWHKHKIVQILVKIVVTVIVFEDHVLRSARRVCSEGLVLLGVCSVCLVYFTSSSTLFCWRTELQLDVEVPLSSLSHSTAHICAQCPCSCIFFSIPAHVHFKL